jgi:NAD(P)-binding Rossmann-like domain
MLRRSFLLWGATAAAGAAAGAAGLWRWQEQNLQVHYAGRQPGHTLREQKSWPAPSEEIETDVVILGSGVAALCAAWQLNKHGHSRSVMIEGPQLYGNAAGGEMHGQVYPTGGHYLPLPSPESTHIRELLHDAGVILRDPYGEQPYYDERFVLHAPEERLLFHGHWQDGFIPTEGVPAHELAEHKRFFAEVERLRAARGRDGKRIFVFPTELSSDDAEYAALDKISLKTWLEQNNYKAPTLHWYLNYCCRDDYGRRYDEVSAWAGLHYYCSRWGQAANAGNGTWLTWPNGLHPLAQALDKLGGQRRRAGTAYSLKTVAGGVEALCFIQEGEQEGGKLRTFRVRARRAICAMPLYVAARVVENIGRYGFNPKQDVPVYAPWMVANFLMRRFPEEIEQPEQFVPLSWDNVVYQEPGLGYVVSTHQDIRQQPPAKTVFSSYIALSDRPVKEARKWMEQAAPHELLELASRDLRTAYGMQLATCVERVDITLRGHAMAVPLPGFLSNPGLRALRQLDGPILFAHADLSGFSVFEEAAWWGCRAARLILKG